MHGRFGAGEPVWPEEPADVELEPEDPELEPKKSRGAGADHEDAQNEQHASEDATVLAFVADCGYICCFQKSADFLR